MLAAEGENIAGGKMFYHWSVNPRKKGREVRPSLEAPPENCDGERLRKLFRVCRFLLFN